MLVRCVVTSRCSFIGIVVRLTRTQRQALFAGQAPHVGGEGEPPCVRGDILKLSTRLSVEILRVDVRYGSGKARWSAHYLVRDTRDPVRQIRRTPPTSNPRPDDFDGYGYPVQIPDGEASEESGYTAGGPSVVHDAGEAVSKEVQEALTAAAHEKGSLDRTQSIDARLAAAHTLEQRIVALEGLARRHNIRAKPEFRHVQRLLGRDDRTALKILDGVEDRVRRKAA